MHHLGRLLWRKMRLYKGLAQGCPVNTVLCVSTGSWYKWYQMMQGHISVFLPSLPFYLTFKSRDRKFMLQALSFVFHSLVSLCPESPWPSTQPSSWQVLLPLGILPDLLAAFCCLWWDPGTQKWQQLESGQDRYRGWIWPNFGKKETNQQITLIPSAPMTCEATPDGPAPTMKAGHRYITLLYSRLPVRYAHKP